MRRNPHLLMKVTVTLAVAQVLAPTMVFQDRLCIATNGTFNTYLSVQQTLTCCEYCYEDYGCWGGWNDYVWDYLLNTGTCTGGTYKSKVVSTLDVS